MESMLDEIKDYWTGRAENYSECILDDLETGKSDHWLNIIGEHADLSKPMKILDIGTGPGFFPMLLKGRGHDVTAIDYTQAMLDIAKKNCEESGAEVNLLRMNAQNLEFEDNTFDLILSRNLVWDLERPRQAYREWLRVLKPNGKMLTFDGNHYLYLYDNVYANAEKKKERSHYKKTETDFGADPEVMQNIAKDLPLSKERRPQWDVNTLMELGAQTVHIHTDGRDSNIVEYEGERVYLPNSFFIFARK